MRHRGNLLCPPLLQVTALGCLPAVHRPAYGGSANLGSSLCISCGIGVKGAEGRQDIRLMVQAHPRSGGLRLRQHNLLTTVSQALTFKGSSLILSSNQLSKTFFYTRSLVRFGPHHLHSKCLMKGSSHAQYEQEE